MALVAPEGEVWTGKAQQVIAKTLDGDIGILTGHTPVLGILAEGSLVRIFPEDGSRGGGRRASAGASCPSRTTRYPSWPGRRCWPRTWTGPGAQTALDAAQSEAGGEETPEIRFLRALLRAAGDRA